MGDYELLEFIARGGMGLVYRARHVPLNRIVAVKVIAAGALAAPDFVERFRLEAKAAASLDHPHIVSIYEIGEHEGQQFFAMRLVEGRSLAAGDGSEPMPLAAVATLMAKVARAVHYAHQRGVLHRDIKPGNILLDASGEPFLTDFGLAKVLAQDSDVTQSVAMLGTPSYMSPEQARGAMKQLTTASDIYSLGAVLYELMAGRPPFMGASTVDVLRQVVEDEPLPLGQWAKAELKGTESSSPARVPRKSTVDSRSIRDLEIICLKCLSKEPHRRYATADALAEELERWLRREPIAARATTGAERAWLWCRRKPRQAMLLALLFLVMMAGVTGVLTQWRRAESNRQRAEQNNDRLEAERKTTRLNLYASDLSAAMSAWREGNIGLARRLLEVQRPAPGASDDLRGFEWRFLWQQLQGDQVRVFRGHSNLVTAAAISPDLKSIVSGGMDGRLHWWDAETGILRSNLLSQSDVALGIGFARDGRHLLAGLGNRFRIFDLSSGLCTLSRREISARAAVAPQADVFAVGLESSFWYGRDGQTFVCDYGHGRTNILSLTNSGGRVAISADGRFVATGVSESSIHFWNTAEGRLLGRATKIESVAGLALSRDGAWLVAATDFSHRLGLWSVPGGERVADLPGHSLAIEAVAASPVSDLVASGGRDQKILLWDLAQRKAVATLMGHESEVRALSFSADGEWLVSGSKDETVRLWRLQSARRLDALTNISVRYGFGAPLISPDGRFLAAATKDAEFNLYDTRTLQLVRGFGRAARPLAFSPDGQFVVSLSSGRQIELWRVASGESLGKSALPVMPNRESMCALSPAGDTVAIGGMRGVVSLCDTRTGRLLWESSKRGGLVLNVAFSPDGQRLAVVGQGQVVRILDAATGSNRVALAGHKWDVRALAFSPDGRWLASGGHDNMIKIWDMTRLREVTTLMGNKSPVSALVFAADGRTLISASDEAVRFWNIATWREVGNFSPPVAARFLALSPALNCFAVADAIDEGPLHFWRVSTAAEIDGRPEPPVSSLVGRWELPQIPAR